MLLEICKRVAQSKEITQGLPYAAER